MRTLVVALAMTVFSASLQAQDSPGTERAEKMNERAEEARQQVLQRALEDYRQQVLLNDLRIVELPRSERLEPGGCDPPAQPTFSLKSGKYSAVQSIRIRDKTPGAIVYYTTDGWTPTVASAFYLSPLTIDSTTTLQAIAITPDCGRSRVASAHYTVMVPSRSVSLPGQTGVGVANSRAILLGLRIHLVFDQDMSSKTARAGDKIRLLLAEDLKVGEVVLVKKGAPASATVTNSVRAKAGGVPGQVSFVAEELDTANGIIKLRGGEVKEGHQKTSAGSWLVILAPPVGMLHGEEAEIRQGTPFDAFVEDASHWKVD